MVVEGTIRTIRTEQRGKEVALYARVETDAGTQVALYMRGHEVRGTLEVGDRVAFSPVDSTDGGPAVTMHVQNLTTDSSVSVWNPPLRRRLLNLTGPAVLSTLLGPVLAAGVISLLAGHGPSPGGWQSVGTVAP